MTTFNLTVDPTIISAVCQNLLHGHTSHTIGDHEFIELSANEWINTQPVPRNRDSAMRVNKMRKIFDPAHDNGYVSTLTEVALGVVVQDFNDIDSDTGKIIRSYKKGEWYRIDGNTRAEYWKLYPERAESIETLTAKIHYLSCEEDVRMAYYPYNSQNSVEKAGEILQGLARRYNWQPRQQVFAKGQYKSAIDWAASGYGDNPDTFKAFNECFEGLKFLDSIPKGSGSTITKPAVPKLKSQAIIAAFLVAHKVWGNKLELSAMIERLSSIEQDEILSALSTTDKELSPIHIIAAEYAELSHLRGGNTGPWLNGLARSTKFESQEVQMDFLLFWIEKYIHNPKITYKARGIKETLWVGAWKEAVSDNFNSMFIEE